MLQVTVNTSVALRAAALAVILYSCFPASAQLKAGVSLLDGGFAAEQTLLGVPTTRRSGLILDQDFLSMTANQHVSVPFLSWTPPGSRIADVVYNRIHDSGVRMRPIHQHAVYQLPVLP